MCRMSSVSGEFHQSAGVDGLAVAQNGDAIAHGTQFLQAMGDVDDCGPAIAQSSHDAEDFLRFGIGQRGGRLVENEKAGTVRDRAADFDQLLAGRAEAFDAPLGLERESCAPR